MHLDHQRNIHLIASTNGVGLLTLKLLAPTTVGARINP